jgi:hypothetical protein
MPGKEIKKRSATQQQTNSTPDTPRLPIGDCKTSFCDAKARGMRGERERKEEKEGNDGKGRKARKGIYDTVRKE